MDLNKYAIGQNDPILNKWEDSDTFHDFLHNCYENKRNQYEITVNEYSKFEHTMNIEVEYDANNDDHVTFLYNLYYNVPEPNQLINAGNGFYLSKQTALYVTDEYEKQIDVDDFKLTSTYKEYYIIDNTDYLEYRKKSIGESKLTEIEAKKIYQVSSKQSKYLLVEASNGFYKTTRLNDISKYKKVDTKKAKDFINSTKNMWNGISVIDTMMPARTIKLLENHDTNLQNAIDTFYKKTGIKLEKVHSTADKVFFHGVEPKHKLDVELTLVLTNGGYSIKELGSGLQMDQEVAINYKPIIQKINKLMREIFSNL